MRLGLKNREAMRAISPMLEAELDFLVDTIKNTFMREHDQDGRHANVTALSFEEQNPNLQNQTPSVDNPVGTDQELETGGGLSEEEVQDLIDASIEGVPLYEATLTLVTADLAAGGAFVIVAGVANQLILPLRMAVSVSQNNQGWSSGSKNVTFSYETDLQAPLSSVNILDAGGEVGPRYGIGLVVPASFSATMSTVGTRDYRGQDLRVNVPSGVAGSATATVIFKVQYVMVSGL